MKKKVILIVASLLFVGATIATTTFLVIRNQKNNNQLPKDENLNDLSKKIIFNHKNKENTEALNVKTEDLTFEGIDQSIYKVSIKKIAVDNLDKSVLNITFIITQIEKNLESSEVLFSLKGFKTENKDPVIKVPTNPSTPTNPPKVSKTKEELNELLKKITVDFPGDKSNTILSDIDSIDLINNNTLETIELKILSKKIKDSTLDVLVVSFVIKEKDSTVESDTKIVEISGFKKPGDDVEKLNKIIENIIPTFKGDKLKTDLSNLDSIEIVYENFPKDVVVIETKKIVDIASPTVLLVTFKIKKVDGNLESFSKTVAIEGFKKMALSEEHLNSIIDQVEANYDGDISKANLDDLTTIQIKYSKVPEGIEILTVNQSVKRDDPTVLIVTFLAKEKNSKIRSKRKVVEISGFKSPRLTFGQFGAALFKINVIFEGDKLATDLSNPNNIDIKYENVHEEVLVKTISKTQKPNDPTTLLVSFKIQEKVGALESSTRTVEIKGFKKLPLSKDDLNSLLKLVNATYKGNVAETKLDNSDSIKIDYDGVPENIEVITVQKTKKLGDNSTLVIHFRIKEKNGKIESQNKTIEISGFKI